jgi:hypothetical protein
LYETHSSQYNTPNFQAFGRRFLKTRAVRLYVKFNDVYNLFLEDKKAELRIATISFSNKKNR